MFAISEDISNSISFREIFVANPPSNYRIVYMETMTDIVVIHSHLSSIKLQLGIHI